MKIRYIAQLYGKPVYQNDEAKILEFYKEHHEFQKQRKRNMKASKSGGIGITKGALPQFVQP